ncbi:MAG: hypothetical protein HOM47_01675 [Euryarchaeota archaeon]|jgi:hypothetical protein|nr:hypothetical protein [Euryarchaeota archaeon]
MSQSFTSRAGLIMMLLLLVLTPLSPLSETFVGEAEAAGSSRHIYTFSDGSIENIALYQGGSDKTTKVAIPKGAEVLDVQVTLSGASSTGWSQVSTDTYEEWMDGEANRADSRSGDLTLGFDSGDVIFAPHAVDEDINSGTSSWLDNGSFAVRQPHTSNSTENRFSNQIKMTSQNFMAQGQGAIIRNHDWLFMSTFTGTSFDKVVNRMHPNNVSRDIVVDLQREAACALPQDPSSTYYKAYGFKDWTITDEEILYGIFSTYKYSYSSSTPTQHLRVLAIDVSNDWTWNCIDSYDIGQPYGEYNGISYDRETDKIWIVHGQQRRIVSYDFGDNGQFTKGEEMYSFSAGASSSTECGKSTSNVHGLTVHSNYFYMRCMKGLYYTDTDQISAWALSGTSSSLVPQAGSIDITAKGFGLHYDGQRLITVDTGYSTWGSKTLYYRELGMGLSYSTTPAPGTTTWVGDTIVTTDDVIAVNVQNHWSAPSQGDRVDYWVSADNGTHWEAVEKNQTIHFAHPGNELIWKMQLIGSSAVSWWLSLEYATSYDTTGDWTSQRVSTGTNVGKVRAVWQADEPTSSSLEVKVSNDNGTTWEDAINNQEVSFSTQGAGNELLYSVLLATSDNSLTPKVDSFILWYEEGYPDAPQLDVGDDNVWDWKSILFLNESSVVASDDSPVGSVVSEAPGLVDAFNSHIPDNGVGTVEITIAVKANTPGRVKLTELNIEYRLKTRVLDASLEGGLVTPDGVYRNLVVRLGHGDLVDKVTEATIGLNNSHGGNPAFKWLRGDSCSVVDDVNEIVSFDVGNCTSTMDSEGTVSVKMPMRVNWTWDDERRMEAIVSMNDDLGPQITAWTTDTLSLNIENDIQLDGMRVWEETGRELYPGDWVRGGFNLSIAGAINFENSAFSPLAGEFDLRVLGQNVTFDGVPIGEPSVLHSEGNPAFGQYNITFTSPIESAPGGMVLRVEAINLATGSTYVNPGYNTIKLIFDGNAPLVLFASPTKSAEMHKGPPSPGGQAIEVIIQDSVDPPQTADLHYWVGCEAGEHEKCDDSNFNGLPEPIEYRSKTLTTPEIRAGGLNIFNGLIDDSMLLHGDKVAFYITGQDGQGNVIAMGGAPVCDMSSEQYCGDRPGEVIPEWDNSLSWYVIREEFEPVMDVDNSTIMGHDDLEPLHPGVSYTATFMVSDINGWWDVDYVQLALAGDFDDDETSIFAYLSKTNDGLPELFLESGGSGLAVSNLYSSVILDPENESRMIVSIKFQLTWNFPEIWDTNGESHFIPKVWVEDKPCGLEDNVPCNIHKAGLGNDLWSLDNDLRFDTQPGHILAIELRDGTNHYNPEFDETLIGAGQALRFSGRVLFAEDETPAPSGTFTIVLGDYENEWTTTSRDGGYFSIDMLVPDVRSGHLDLRAKLVDLPGLAEDESEFKPRLRLAVDSERPTIHAVYLAGIAPGEDIPISLAGNLQVMLETRDDQGFTIENPAVMHYLVRAGEAEISRGSSPLPDTTPFEDQFFWTGYIDLTDGGATMLLPSYTIDVWVTGSDASGNPYDSDGNTLEAPLASWPLALTGPDVSLRAADTLWSWSNPTPIVDESVSLTVEARNSGASGNVTFVLQRLTSGENWETLSSVDISVSSGKTIQVKLLAIADGEVGDTLDHRLLLLDSGVEKERISITPLLIKGEVDRDGTALANQVADSQLSVVMYLIALGAMSYAVWTMVQIRKIRRGEEVDESDHTAEVEENMDGKLVPSIGQAETPNVEGAVPLAPGPPIPPSGLPTGWTMDQWSHYGHQYIESLVPKK